MRSGYFGQHFRKRQSVIAVILIAVILTMIGQQTPAQENAKVYRSVVRKLVHIPAQKAKEQLIALGLGMDINKLDNMNALIITTDSIGDRFKVASVLNLIDSELEYEVTRLAAAVDTKKVPDTEKINAAVKGIEIGSFIDPPTSNDAAVAIVDIHDQDLIAIAPKGLIKPIISGLATLRYSGKAKTKTLKIENNATVSPAAQTVNTATKEHDIVRMSETVQTSIAVVKAETKAEPATVQTAAAEDYSDLSPAMRQLKEAQRELSDALKNADTGSVNEFMGNAETARQVRMLAKNDYLDSGLLDVIKEAQEKSKEREEPKAKPARTEPSRKKPDTGAIPSKTKRVTPPAAKVRPAKIAATPKAPAPKKDDGLAEVMKMIQDMEAAKAAPVATEPVKASPVKSELEDIAEPRVAPDAAKKDAGDSDKPEKISSAKIAADNSDNELETTISLPTKVQITKLLELVGMQLGLNYMYEPSQVTGEVTLFIHDGGKIKVGELYSLVESVLKFKGFVMTRHGKLVTIVKQGDTTSIDPKIILPGEDIGEYGNVVVTKVFKLEHVDTATAQKMLTEMKLGISVQSIPENSTMIITGYAYRMGRIQEVLNLVDLPGKKKLFKYRMLEYLTPSQLVPKLQVLANELGTVSISVSATTAAAPATPVAKPTSAAARARALKDARARAAAKAKTPTATSTIGAATAKTVYLDIDDRTNRILMIGLKDTIAVVEDLINILDVKQQGIKLIRQYKVEFVNAAMVVDILSELGVTDAGARPTTAPATRSPKTPATTMRGASSGEGPKISILTESNSLLVNATLEKHDEIIAIIEHIDVENLDERTIKEYEIQHVDTEEILDTLAELGIAGGQSNKSSNRSSSSRSNSTARPTTTSKTPTARQTTTMQQSSFSEPLVDEPQIAILETTNSLLVNATAKQHAAIAMVIAHVDRELTENSTPYVIYPLENQDPEELKPILDELVNATIQAKTDGKSGSSSASTSTSKIISQSKSSGLKDKDDNITIVSDPATYSLVVYASKKNQLWIGNLITELDAYRPQVLLDVTLVEVSKNDDFSYDLNLLSSIPDLALGNTSGLANNIIGGESPVSAASIFDKLMNSGQSSFTDMQSHGGNFTGFYGNNKIMALFNAMQKKNYGRILAKPKLLVDDNQEGTIETKNTVYIERKTTTSQSSDTGQVVLGENIEFEPYDASISLKIKPHISKGENLRLEITLTRSDFVNLDPTSTKPPDQATSDVVTVATVPNNHTIILGGMDKINQSKGGTKIPILGDIPFIGGLFRSTGNTSSQRKLYVFVKAHILRPGENPSGNTDLINISRKQRKEFERYEGEMQEYEDWPGIKPQPMDPLQILEGDEYLDSVKSDEIGSKAYIEVKL